MGNGYRQTIVIWSIIATLTCLVLPCRGQWHPKDTEWPTYTADLSGSKYRPLNQIDASNFSKLELKGKEIPNTGMNGYNGCGVLVTKTLVIIGDSQVTSVTHPRGAMMRAYDKATGKEVGAVWMPAPVSGSPMTYMWQGKQFIVIAVSGGNYSGEYIAFALPDAD